MPPCEEFLRSETEHAEAARTRLLTMKVGWVAVRMLRKWVAFIPRRISHRDVLRMFRRAPRAA